MVLGGLETTAPDQLPEGSLCSPQVSRRQLSLTVSVFWESSWLVDTPLASSHIDTIIYKGNSI